MKKVFYLIVCITMLFSCSKNTDTSSNPTPIPTPKNLPVISTTSAWLIRQTTARVGLKFANRDSVRDATTAGTGICYSTSPNPTITNAKKNVAYINPGSIYDIDLTGLTSNTTYYVRAYATNTSGTAYGNQITFTTVAPSTFTIGQHYQGGIIFYANGTHGLIAYTSDIGDDNYEWGCQGDLITWSGDELRAGKGQAVGFGQQNTQLMLTHCSHGSTAATLCNDFTANGYSDWFLPSIEELRLMYDARSFLGIGGLFENYWSSSEYNTEYCYGIDFSTGYGYDSNNAVSKYVGMGKIQPVRAF